MKLIKLFTALLTLLVLGSLGTGRVSAICGGYYNSSDACGIQIPGGILQITPFVVCEGSVTECCSNQHECKDEVAPKPVCLSPSGLGIDSAIGCIPITSNQVLLSFILRWIIGIGGGIAFLLLVYASVLYLTSSGDRSKVQAAQELFTAAITGLLLLIFSVFVLYFLGIHIIGLRTAYIGGG